MSNRIGPIMASLERIFGGTSSIPLPITSLVSDPTVIITPEVFTKTLSALGHITTRRDPEKLVHALKSGNVLTHQIAQSTAETSEISHQPYPLSIQLPFDFTVSELKDYSVTKKFLKSHSRDREIFLSTFNDSLRISTPQRIFPEDRELYEVIQYLMTTLWTLTDSIDRSKLEKRYREIMSAFAAYLQGKVPDPRFWRTPICGKNILRDFYLFRMCAMAVNEAYYSKCKIPTLVPLSHYPPFSLTPSRFEDCRTYLFRIFYDSESVSTLLKRTGISRYLFDVHTHGLTERMLLDYFEPVPINEPLRVHDVVAFPQSMDYFENNGLSHVGRVVYTKGPHVWIESKWGVLTNPVVHRLEMRPLMYGDLMFVARPTNDVMILPSRETFAEAGYHVPSSGAPKPEEISQAADRLVQEITTKDLPWIHENF